jgi:hypothetical protein
MKLSECMKKILQEKKECRWKGEEKEREWKYTSLKLSFDHFSQLLVVRTLLCWGRRHLESERSFHEVRTTTTSVVFYIRVLESGDHLVE